MGPLRTRRSQKTNLFNQRTTSSTGWRTIYVSLESETPRKRTGVCHLKTAAHPLVQWSALATCTSIHPHQRLHSIFQMRNVIYGPELCVCWPLESTTWENIPPKTRADRCGRVLFHVLDSAFFKLCFEFCSQFFGCSFAEFRARIEITVELNCTQVLCFASWLCFLISRDVYTCTCRTGSKVGDCTSENKERYDCIESSRYRCWSKNSGYWDSDE